MSTPSEDPKYSEQLKHEEDMRAAGSERFLKLIAEAREAGRESETDYGSRLVSFHIAKVSGAISSLLAHAKSGAAGRRHQAVMYLEMIPPDVAAFIATKGVLDGIMARVRLQNAAIRIGSMIEDEVRFTHFEGAEQVDPRDGTTKSLKALFKTIQKNLNAQTANYAHKKKVLVHCMNKQQVAWENWPKTDKMHLGIKLIELVIETTGVAEIHQMVKKNHKELYLEATETTLAWINHRTGWKEALCAVYQPMVIPPVDWTSPVGGGYLSKCHPKLKLVKSRSKQYLEELYSADLGLIYNVVNGLQRTAWKVNAPVLKVMREVWDIPHCVYGGLPSREENPKPPKPVDIDTNPEARKVWRRSVSESKRGNLKLGSKRLQTLSTILTAEKFQTEPAIYFPYTLDFRGRVYAVPIGLQPQGHDIAKGLLTLARGKPLGTQRAADWLAIHGANLFGFDKVSLEDRVQWAAQNRENIVNSAAAPLDYLWWERAEKPWQFLAFCFEWAEYLKQGLSFVSSLPIALDGSCNGLQHFSAMLRDPIGGAATNLTPSPKPQDIYQTVADKTIAKLKADGSALAMTWLAFGITRKTTKRSVMVVPYGGTRHSARNYVLEHVQGRLDDGEPNLFGDSSALFTATTFLAGLVWDSISETVVAARDAMGWLQAVSQVVSKEEKAINWLAPTGFPVQQAYPEMKSRRVETKILGKTVMMNLAEEVSAEPKTPTHDDPILKWTSPSGFPVVQAYYETHAKEVKTSIQGVKHTLSLRFEGTLTPLGLGLKLDKRKQAMGISPNFVHSLDAAALMFTVDACMACGLDSFGMVHDSYATVAADTDTLRECLRQSFCQMYQMDVLKAFRDEIQEGLPEGVELPELPNKGTLDINLVLESDFFFA